MEDEDEDDEEMEDDEPYPGPRTLPLTRQEFKPRTERLVSESVQQQQQQQQRVPNEAT